LKSYWNVIKLNLISINNFHFKLFTDTDRKHKAFFRINSLSLVGVIWDAVIQWCKNLNTSLVEMQTAEEQFIFNTLLSQFGFTRMDWTIFGSMVAEIHRENGILEKNLI
jgi:hypothetical protein